MSRFWIILLRSVRLRCPLCGAGKLFRGYFRQHETCPKCGLKFQREPGFYLGSIYFNYGLTTFIVAVVYPLLLFTEVLSNDVLLWLSLAFVVVFPAWFFRYARSLWIGFDQYCDPREDSVEEP